MRLYRCYICCVMMLVFSGFGKAEAQDQRLPDDPEIIIGKLDNGLTYYIRHNSNPKGCADFYIAHNVGALQEEDNQNGLAHFLEHMAFNGTKNYPQKTLFDFLAKEGVRFGYNINAYTSRTETVYNLSDIPLVRESFVDSVLMVLHDWSGDILCEQDALDAERGVISEEWRRGDEQRARMADAQFRLVHKGSNHAERDVIGTLEIINGFRREEILDFYKRWYRPDLQAIIVVGDFNPEEMENRVRRIFSDIPAPTEPEPKQIYEIPSMDEPLFENMLDPDIRFQTLKVIHRMRYPGIEERAQENFWKQHYQKQIVTSVIEKRLRQAAKDSPVSSAVIVTSNYGADFYTSLFTLSAKSDDLLEETLEFYCREVKRLLDHGFTKDEFNAAKFQVLRKNRLDAEKDAASVTNEDIVKVCKEHFLRSRPTTFPSDLHEIQKDIMGEITYEEALTCLSEMLEDSEKIYSYSTGTSKADKIPSAERMKEIIAKVGTEDTEPSPVTFAKVDLEVDVPAGTITKIRQVKGTEGEEWTLSNGAKVYWMPSDRVSSATHLAMELRFGTGFRTWPQDSIGACKAAASYIARNTGFGSAGYNDIAGSPDCGGVRVTFEFEKEHSTIRLTSGTDDAETGFRMLHMYLSKPYFDTEANLRRFRSNTLRSLGMVKNNQSTFAREHTKAKMEGHPWTIQVDSADVNALDMNMIHDTYRRSFTRPEDLTLFICSDMEPEKVRAYVEKYLASWTSGHASAVSEERPFVSAYRGETVLDRTYPAISSPKADVRYDFLAHVKPSAKNEIAYEVLDYIMSKRCVDRIREERGGTYHVRFATENLFHDDTHESSVTFQTRPEMTDILVRDVQDLIDDLCANGPTEEEMDMAVKYLIKADAERKQKLADMLNVRLGKFRDHIVHGTPYGHDYEKTIRSLKAKDIRKLAAKVNEGNRFIAIYREN